MNIFGYVLVEGCVQVSYLRSHSHAADFSVLKDTEDSQNVELAAQKKQRRFSTSFLN